MAILLRFSVFASFASLAVCKLPASHVHRVQETQSIQEYASSDLVQQAVMITQAKAFPITCLIVLLFVALALHWHWSSAAQKEAGAVNEGSAAERSVSVYRRDCVAMMKLTWPLILGNTLEWYEYGIYGYTATQMNQNFFQGSALATWLGYAITFVARPFGGVVLGWIADNMGRSISVQLSLIGMLFGTVGQGCLPGHYLGRSYESFGLVVLVFLRALQGLSAGGEVCAISSYMVESVPHHVVGWSTMLISFGGAAGFGMAATFCDALNRMLTKEQMLTWGWRVPFVISIFPGLVALVGRNNIPETEAFLEEQEKDDSNDEKDSAVYELIRYRYTSLLVGLGAVIGIGTMWYVGPIWTVNALLEPNLGAETSLSIASAGQWFTMLLSPMIGILTDTKGIAWVVLAGASVISLSALPVWMLIALNPTSTVTACMGIVGMWSVAQAVCGSTIYLFCAELFPTRLRTLGMSLSYNIAVSYFGGLGPALCQLLIEIAPLYGPGLWMSLCGFTSVLAVLWGLSLKNRGLLQLTHIREEPYFGSVYGADGELLVRAATSGQGAQKP
mmetsp:Transcript_28147/g.49073  ORF Transcript_28147/g.49073 Transcript_28147/m.49073 type:complete len:560 (+) Transcript_28147:80-1759(+)